MASTTLTGKAALNFAKDQAGRKAFASALGKPKVKPKTKATKKKKSTPAKGKKKLTAAEKAGNAAFGRMM
jgi:hypothetical protein